MLGAKPSNKVALEGLEHLDMYPTMADTMSGYELDKMYLEKEYDIAMKYAVIKGILKTKRT